MAINIQSVLRENRELKQEILDKDTEILNLKDQILNNDLEKTRIETSTLCRAYDSCRCKECPNFTNIQYYSE